MTVIFLPPLSPFWCLSRRLLSLSFTLFLFLSPFLFLPLHLSSLSPVATLAEREDERASESL